MYDAVLALIYLVLVIDDFKVMIKLLTKQYSEYVYDNFIEECVHG